MSEIVRDFMGGPFDGEGRVVNEKSMSIVAQIPAAKISSYVGSEYCKYCLKDGLMIYVGTGTKTYLAKRKL